MIGRIEFPKFPDDGTVLSATLEDNQTWTCEDAAVDEFLNMNAPPQEGYLPEAKQLYVGRDVLPDGAKIVEEKIEPVDPNRVY